MAKVITGVSLDAEVLDETKRLAKENNRPFSNYVNILLLANIEKERGKKPKKKKNSTLKRRKE